jgi:CRISPR-associated protein Cas2
MMVLVSYDVMVTSSGGQTRRVQYSVFECVVDPAQWVKLKNISEKTIDEKKDSLRYYYLGANYKRRIEHVGAKPSYDVDSPIII